MCKWPTIYQGKICCLAKMPWGMIYVSDYSWYDFLNPWQIKSFTVKQIPVVKSYSQPAGSQRTSRDCLLRNHRNWQNRPCLQVAHLCLFVFRPFVCAFKLWEASCWKNHFPGERLQTRSSGPQRKTHANVWTFISFLLFLKFAIMRAFF